MKKWGLCFLLLVGCLWNCRVGFAVEKIDRQAVLTRHNIVTTRGNPKSPAQVGNGHFAFGLDQTGLQTFTPFNILSDWAWHQTPLPSGMRIEDFEPTIIETYNRSVPYAYPDAKHPELSAWLAGNPHRFNLGRIGLRLLKADGTEVTEKDIQNSCQVTDLWTGIISSTFSVEGVSVSVQTGCHPDQDTVGVSVESELIRQGRLFVFVDFPYSDGAQFADYVGTYAQPQLHTSTLVHQGATSAQIARVMDDARYSVLLDWSGKGKLFSPTTEHPHRFEIQPARDKESFSFVCNFTPQGKKLASVCSVQNLFRQSKRAWRSYWKSGAAVDLSQSKDARWFELERRIVLSQYLMRVNEAGSLPPQESGLVNNGWFGRHHFEMVWWHGVHYGLWNRWNIWEQMLGVYHQFLPTSMERAQAQGYKGARWPKCTGNVDREWPHPIHATLIWQQPHPIYFAEMDYRQHPTRATLLKWKEVVFQTADFMADYCAWDPARKQYLLGPPVYIVSENTDNLTTKNPAFELAYWRYGLRVASEWRSRLGMDPNLQWKFVLDHLSPLPEEEGLYVTFEGIQEMWTKYTFEHPALTGIYGMLPGDGVDQTVFRSTLAKVVATWNFDRTWGWDFPMVAMAAARSGQPHLAVDMLLHPSAGFQFDEHGLCTGGPFPYFPANGGLLTAVAMMVGGWDGAENKNAPGFPQDGTWTVRFEKFVPME